MRVREACVSWEVLVTLWGCVACLQWVVGPPPSAYDRSYKLVMTVLRSLNSKNRWLIPECNVCNVNRSVFRPVRYRFYAYMESIWYVPSP